MDSRDVLVMLLAGGRGDRLEPLTRHRAKPAVPFGGIYRLVDFTLSNCLNSGLRRIQVLVQYKNVSLARHLRDGWSFLSSSLGEYIETVPPQMRVGDTWYQGTADAIYQNLYSIEREDPRYILVVAGDHIYKMDYAEMIRHHIENGADMTVSVVEVPKPQALGFGILEVDGADMVRGFQEKPKDPKPTPGNPDLCLASMGIYVFTAAPLTAMLNRDAADPESSHDFGKDIIPRILTTHKVCAFRFQDKNKKEAKYWRDVGTIDAYFEANMDLISVSPHFNLYDTDWPIRTAPSVDPPPKFVFAQEYPGGRLGVALDSLVAQGCIVSGGRVQNSILSPRVRVNSYSQVRESILFEGVEIGRYAKVRRAIIDKDVKIPEGTEIGYNLADDRRRFRVSEGGVVVLSKGEVV
ncbi:MAG: glucose-1-phosphate adenylyltransferase [Planctomycetes bacterium]|nr:glucose-1-phosphate adenylyltransferase [Planctomycetota bacterium]